MAIRASRARGLYPDVPLIRQMTSYLLALILASVVSAQFVMLPPNVLYGRTNYTGFWIYGNEFETPVNARLAYDRSMGQATRLLLTFPDIPPPDGGNPFVAFWFRYIDPSVVSIFQGKTLLHPSHHLANFFSESGVSK